MPSTLGSAVLELRTDATKLNRGLKKAEQDTDASLGRMNKLSAGLAAASPYVAIGAAAAAAGTAVVGMLNDVARIEEELRPHLGRTSLAVEDLQLLAETAERVGSENALEGIVDSIQEMNLQLGEGIAGETNKFTKAIDALGISVAELAHEDDLAQFDLIVAALHDIDDLELRTFYADEIFGGSWEYISGIISGMPEDIAAIRQELSEDFNFLSEEQIQRLREYNDAKKDLGQTWDDVWQTAVVGAAPAITGAIDGITAAIDLGADAYDKHVEILKDWGSDFQTWSDDVDESVVDAGRSIGDFTADVVGYFSPELGEKVRETSKSVNDAVEDFLLPIPADIQKAFDEEGNIASYFDFQKEPIETSLSEIAEVAKAGATDINAKFIEELSRMGSMTADALLGGGAEGEGNLMPSGSVMFAFQQLGPEVKKVIEQGFGEYITPSWRNALTEIGSATWDAFYGGAEGEGSFAVIPTVKTGLGDLRQAVADAAVPLSEETDTLMYEGLEKEVKAGFEDVSTEFGNGMSDLEGEVETAKTPMKTKMDVYGDFAIEAPIKNAMLEAARIVGEELAAIEAAAAAAASRLATMSTSGFGVHGEGPSGSEILTNAWIASRPYDKHGRGGWAVKGQFADGSTRTLSIHDFKFQAIAAAEAARENIDHGVAYSQTLAQAGVSTPTPTLPGLPSMDSGGIVSGPTLAALAMNSRPEAVIPLDRLGGMGTTIVFEGPVYGMDDFRDKVQEATLLGNRQGRQEVFYGAR